MINYCLFYYRLTNQKLIYFDIMSKYLPMHLNSNIDKCLLTAFKGADSRRALKSVKYNTKFSSTLAEDSYYHCPNNCGRKYKYEGSLSNHLRLECGKEPQFQCILCGRKFKQKVHMKSHLFAVHEIIPK